MSDDRTTDELVGEVAIDDWRTIRVYRRTHDGRDFVRWRMFHRHRSMPVTYPDRWRGGVIPLQAAEAFGLAIAAAARTE